MAYSIISFHIFISNTWGSYIFGSFKWYIFGECYASMYGNSILELLNNVIQNRKCYNPICLVFTPVQRHYITRKTRQRGKKWCEIRRRRILIYADATMSTYSIKIIRIKISLSNIPPYEHIFIYIRTYSVSLYPILKRFTYFPFVKYIYTRIYIRPTVFYVQNIYKFCRPNCGSLAQK